MLPQRQLLPRQANSFRLGMLPSPAGAGEPLIHINPPPAPPTPEMVDWTRAQKDWGVMGNDTAGDCVLATMAHLVECWTGVTQNEVVTPDQTVLNDYSALTGYNQNTHVPDPGMTVAAGLTYFQGTGFLGHTAFYFRKSTAANLGGGSAIRAAVYRLGAAVVALNLPVAAATAAFQAGNPWSGNMGPGTVGHCVPIIAFDAQYFDVITWGGIQRMDFPFLQQYCTEFWGVAGNDWVSAKAPLGADPRNLIAHVNWLMVQGRE